MLNLRKFNFDKFITEDIYQTGFTLPKKIQEMKIAMCSDEEKKILDKYFYEKSQEKILSWGQFSSLQRQNNQLETYRSSFLDDLSLELIKKDSRFYEFELIQGLMNLDIKIYEDREFSKSFFNEINNFKKLEIDTFKIQVPQWNGTKKNACEYFIENASEHNFEKISINKISKKYKNINLTLDFDIGGKPDLINKLPIYGQLTSDAFPNIIWHLNDLNSIVDCFDGYKFFKTSQEAILGIKAYVFSYNKFFERICACIAN